MLHQNQCFPIHSVLNKKSSDANSVSVCVSIFEMMTFILLSVGLSVSASI